MVFVISGQVQDKYGAQCYEFIADRRKNKTRSKKQPEDPPRGGGPTTIDQVVANSSTTTNEMRILQRCRCG